MNYSTSIQPHEMFCAALNDVNIGGQIWTEFNNKNNKSYLSLRLNVFW